MSRWRVRRVVAVAAVAVLAVVGVANADAYVQRRSMRGLLDVIESNERQIVVAMNEITVKVRELEEYGRRDVAAEYITGLEAQTEADVSAVANRAAEDVIVNMDAIARLRTLPWHGRFRSARAAYQTRAAAWRDRLTLGGRDIKVFMSASSPSIDATHTILCRDMRDATGRAFEDGLRRRVDALCILMNTTPD